jgi:hypothetical protein
VIDRELKIFEHQSNLPKHASRLIGFAKWMSGKPPGTS